MKERVSVVDENDNVLVEVFRTELDRVSQIYRTVGAFVIFEDKTILMQRRALDKKTHAGQWDIVSAAGYVQADEDYASAAIREIKEEVGLKLDDPIFIQKSLAKNSIGGRKFLANFVFFAPNEMKNQIKISEREVVGVERLTIDEIIEDFAKNQEKYTHHAENSIKILTNFLKEVK